MKKAREIEVEVVSADEPLRRGADADPLIAFVARLMDSVFTLPGTRIRFGLDPLLGLLPGFGDSASALISVLLICRSVRYGLPRIIVARMALNVFLNAALGAVPVFGDAFSFWFKSNAKNYALLQKHAGTRRGSTRSDWTFVVAVIVGLILAITLVIIGAVKVITTAIHGLS